MNNPSEFHSVIAGYPSTAQAALSRLRGLILTAADQADIQDLTETLKWGEPSFQCKSGSTLRIDWKPKYPDSVSLFVNCKTSLIETIRERYPGALETVGSREVRLPLDQAWHADALDHLIRLTLTYHRVKHLPLLGA